MGLGYVRLGQTTPTLSGGEAQRVKLSSELTKRGHRPHRLRPRRAHDRAHFEDIRKLLGVLSRLVDQGDTVLVIEHNLDVLKTADWIIDLGPEGDPGEARWWPRAPLRRSPPIRRATPASSSPACSADRPVSQSVAPRRQLLCSGRGRTTSTGRRRTARASRYTAWSLAASTSSP